MSEIEVAVFLGAVAVVIVWAISAYWTKRKRRCSSGRGDGRYEDLRYIYFHDDDDDGDSDDGDE